MALNPFFNAGSRNERDVLEDLLIESIQTMGQEFYYIPRTLIAKDEILGEDRLSRFKNAYPIEMYLENANGFEGQGSFMQKFGLMIEQSATLTLSRRRWAEVVGEAQEGILPNRPAEGDLLYFPLTNGLFVITFVQHQDPFYQLGKLYTYKIEVELFQYASERIDTGIEEIDAFESLKSFTTDMSVSENGFIKKINVLTAGVDYISPPYVNVEDLFGSGAEAVAILSSSGSLLRVDVLNGGKGYSSSTTVTLEGGGGTGATVELIIVADVDAVDSFGDNNEFKKAAGNIVQAGDNIIGNVGD